jgi:hypothetical protein
MLNRRQCLKCIGLGFGQVALIDLLARDGLLAAPAGPLSVKRPHFAPKAKSVIWLFMEGGPSACDTFDPKPMLTKFDGKQPPKSIDVYFGKPGPLMGSPFEFSQHGQCGAWVADTMPHIAQHVDKLAFLKGCYSESNNHSPAMYQMNTGLIRAGYPSVGSWTTYGLGSENQNLPGFVVLPSTSGSKGGPQNWGAGFLPGAYQGVGFRATGSPLLNLDLPKGMELSQQRRMLDLAAQLNQEHRERHPDEADLLARIDSYELAYRMQADAKEAVDLSSESENTKKLYGLDEETTRPYGEKCLLARRLVERGVRFVQAYVNRDWDAHTGLISNHTDRPAETDKPVAGLLADLEARGLLDSTLVVWGGEFGRMPVSQSGQGRDHNPDGFLIWMAGAGIRGGVSHGGTDDIGHKAVEGRTSVHDIHATILHLLGLDHTLLTYEHNGRRFRLTDVAGEIIRPILA